jgi:hypothetical protein
MHSMCNVPANVPKKFMRKRSGVRYQMVPGHDNQSFRIIINSDRFHAYVRKLGDDFDREDERVKLDSPIGLQAVCPFPSRYRGSMQLSPPMAPRPSWASVNCYALYGSSGDSFIITSLLTASPRFSEIRL